MLFLMSAVMVLHRGLSMSSLLLTLALGGLLLGKTTVVVWGWSIQQQPKILGLRNINYNPRCHVIKGRYSIRHGVSTRLKGQEGDNSIDDDDDNDDDDDEPPDVDIRNFRYNSEGENIHFGLNRGRSSPLQRKAIGTSSKTTTSVYVCTNCGSESVQWRGRCPTCKEWNTYQEFSVQRSQNAPGNVGGMAHNLLSNSVGRPIFSSSKQQSNSLASGQSWLDGINGSSISSYNNNNYPISITNIDLQSSKRKQRLLIPHDNEMNQVLGGGIMKGSLVLLGGDPGVGKSTLALQIAIQIAILSKSPIKIGMGLQVSTAVENDVGPVWYISGEETLEQIATRANRLVNNVENDKTNNDDDDSSTTKKTTRIPDTSIDLPSQLFLLSETNLNVLADQVIHTWMQNNQIQKISSPNEEFIAAQQLPPSLLVIDSIQTMVCESGGISSAGGISQVRECMALLLRLAKTTQIPILVIGHVTKTGDVAGPRMVEHMVDAVLYLEHSSSGSASTQGTNYRWLRAQKNRFGSCQTVGLYDFQHGMLVPLPEGSEMALLPPSTDLEGCAMGICIEGQHRAITVEVQALVTTSGGSYGKKTVEGGISYPRLSLLLGILQKHCQLSIAGSSKMGRDVYVNVVGCSGIISKSQQSSITMALDLAVTVALTSSFLRIPVRGDTAFLAQVGLLGELRPLQSIESRLLQAQRSGFSRVIVAGGNGGMSSFSSTSGSRNKKNSSNVQTTNNGVKQTRKYDMDIFECTKLKDALDLALIAKISDLTRRKSRKPKKDSEKTGSSTSIERIPYADENIILDDEDDDDDDELIFL